MTDARNEDRDERPGKTRTWWHPLLARLMDHLLSGGYTVHEEVLVGKLPLRVDILLIRREGGRLSEASRRDLSVLVPLLNRYTLVEFKGPTDSVEAGDAAQLFGCSFLWHSQQAERVPREDISLIILAPTANDALHTELRSLSCQIRENEPGIHRVDGVPFATWLVETDVMAGLGQPILSLVSRVFLREHERIIEALRDSGRAPLLHYMLQQIQQFRTMGEGFAMQHTDSEYLGVLTEELQTAVLQGIPVEKRLEGLSPEEVLQGIPVEKRLEGLSPEEVMKGIPVEKRLEGLSPEERVRGLAPEEVVQRYSPEELAAGLTPEQAARLRELLERKLGK